MNVPFEVDDPLANGVGEFRRLARIYSHHVRGHVDDSDVEAENPLNELSHFFFSPTMHEVTIRQMWIVMRYGYKREFIRKRHFKLFEGDSHSNLIFKYL